MSKRTHTADSTDDPWRLFIAVPLPDEVKQQVADAVTALRETSLPFRWVDPDSGHLTVHFLGDVEPESAELLRLSLALPLEGHTAFDLRTSEPGTFPALKRPRVLWLGLWGPAHRLEAIYNDLGDFLDDFGVELEERPFHPHITLGRLRSEAQRHAGTLAEPVRTAFADLDRRGIIGKDHQISLPVREIQLIRSHLSKDGARYEVLGTYPLPETNPDD